jgi:hypothetical protein
VKHELDSVKTRFYHHTLSRIKDLMVLSPVPENKTQEHNTRWFNQLHSPSGRRIQQHWESTLRFWFGACNWHLVNRQVPIKESSVLLTWYTKLANHCTWHKTAISLTILSFVVWFQGPRFISCMHYSCYFQHLKVPWGCKPQLSCCEFASTTFCTCKNHIQQPHGSSAECQKRS